MATTTTRRKPRTVEPVAVVRPTLTQIPAGQDDWPLRGRSQERRGVSVTLYDPKSLALQFHGADARGEEVSVASAQLPLDVDLVNVVSAWVLNSALPVGSTVRDPLAAFFPELKR